MKYKWWVSKEDDLDYTVWMIVGEGSFKEVYEHFGTEEDARMDAIERFGLDPKKETTEES